ncbi:MAG: radical SAM protein [Melioribacteraceae bacterium]|nr:radical SAM protein [Melioribacteraceae bacterium]
MRSPWLKREYRISSDVKSFSTQVGETKYIILINPNYGSWIALNESEYERYINNKFNEIEWESLFYRKLAEDINGEELELELMEPANYPSVVVVNITSYCNLRCRYCFADCSPMEGLHMSEEVMKRIIDDMLQMPDIKNITFEFQGGEATLNISGMKNFIEIAEERKKEFNKTIKYRMESNCVAITDEIIELIKKYNINFGISLDGPKDMNDSCRVGINDEGSFENIMKGIQKLRNEGVFIDGAVCTIGQHNVKYPELLLEFFNDMKISFKPRPVNILGREKESNLTTKPGEWAKCFQRMSELSENYDIENFSNHIFEENVYTPIRDYICLRYPCGAARELISVNPNGDVIPCDGFKNEKDFIMGNVLKESILDMLVKDEVVKLRNRTSDTIEKCKECLFRAMCCSCSYSAYGKFGNVYREDPHCSDRKEIFVYLMKKWISNNTLCN